MSTTLSLRRRGVADGDLVREERSQHHRHASVHASAVGGGRPVVGGEERLGNLQGDRQAVLASCRGAPRRRAGCRAAADHARFSRRNRAGARRQGLEARRMRIHSRRHRAEHHRRRARLSQHLQTLHRAGAADAQARQRLEGHHLADGRRRRRTGCAQPAGHRGRADQGLAANRHRYRRRRDDSLPGAGNQRPRRRQRVGGDVEADRALASPPGRDARGREDPLSRHPGAAAQGDHVADLVRDRQRGSQLHVELHQRQRADPLAHADRAPAVLPGPSLDARLRRGAMRVQAAGGHAQRGVGAHAEVERQQGDRAQLHHAAPEVGHSFDVHRQPDHADAVARRADRVDFRNRCDAGRHRRQRLDRALQRQWRADGACGGEPARQSRACA